MATKRRTKSVSKARRLTPTERRALTALVRLDHGVEDIARMLGLRVVDIAPLVLSEVEAYAREEVEAEREAARKRAKLPPARASVGGDFGSQFRAAMFSDADADG